MIIHPSTIRGLRLIAGLALCIAYPAAAQEQKAAVAATAPQSADAPKPPAPDAQKPAAAKPAVPAPKGPWVRRFSMGGNFSFLAQPSIPNVHETRTFTTEYSVESWADAKRRPFGGGIIFQTTLTPRLALASGVSFRLQDFSTTDITYEGVDDTTTAYDDERTANMKQNTTRARLLDVPVLLRRYSKNHAQRGRRYFYEGGTTLRFVHGIHSFGLTTAEGGTETCCDETSLKPAHRVLPGFVVGAGFQFVDDFGIRFVPEIRYTRWMGRTFDTFPARSRVDQIELGFSVTF